MNNKKVERVIKEIFGKQKTFAERFNISTTKVSAVVNGLQSLSANEIAILLTEYHIDPYWFFGEEDTGPVEYNKNKPPKEDISLYKKYTQSLEKVNYLMEELEEYKSNKKK